MKKKPVTTWTFDVSSAKNKAKIAAWNARVIRDICLRTRPITPDERAHIVAALHGMYEAAKLPHDDLRIVFVPSPFMAHIVARHAGAWWAPHSYAAATVAATDDATVAAARAATVAATRDATVAATDAATVAARAATRAARDVERDGLVGAIRFMIAGATRVSPQSLDAFQLRDSGSDWYHWHSYLAFVRDAIGWSDPSHANFAHGEIVQRLGGPRYMHSKFVVVSDHPTVRNVVWINGVATLHCETGPAVAWADGTAIYAIDGVVLPHDGIGQRIVESPASLTIAEIDSIDNADARSIAIRRFGWHRYVREIHSDCIDYRHNDIEGTREAIFRTPKDGNILVAVCPTGRVFGMRVPSTVKDCAEAQSYLAGSRAGRTVART